MAGVLFHAGLRFRLSKEKVVGQGSLDEEDGGDSEGEFAVLRFVAEEAHAQEGADAAAGNGQPDEGVFGDAPLPSPGLPFVNAVDQEGQDIDADEIDNEVSHGGNCTEKWEFSGYSFFVPEPGLLKNRL